MISFRPSWAALVVATALLVAPVSSAASAAPTVVSAETAASAPAAAAPNSTKSKPVKPKLTKAEREARAKRERKRQEKKKREDARKFAKKQPVLATGAKGEKVRALQRMLRKSGYWVSSIDGKFGYSTKQAVWAVQKATGRARTGKVTQGVWYELRLGTRAKTKITAKQSKGKRVFEVDLSEQILNIVKDGEVLWTFNVSTGSNSYYTSPRGNRVYAYTPTGSFQVFMKRNYLHRAPLGAMYRPQYFRHGGWAIHGSPDIPARPASHGCIRIENRAMDYLWSKGGLGMKSNIIIRK